MISFESVTRAFGKKIAVDELSLEVAAGEVFALLGRNGAGKTTSIKMLVGLLSPTSGTIKVMGQTQHGPNRPTHRILGYVPDEPQLYDKLTGREFLQFVAEMHGLAGDAMRRAIDEQVEQFSLQEFADRLSEGYSHGMKQRVVFAAAMINSPCCLVVDEPMVGLDPHSARLVKDLLRSEADNGSAVLMSTHTLSTAEEIADRVGVMLDGRLIFAGSVAELRGQLDTADGSLEQLYISLIDKSATPQPSERKLGNRAAKSEQGAE